MALQNKQGGMVLGNYFEVALHLAKIGVGILSRGGILEIMQGCLCLETILLFPVSAICFSFSSFFMMAFHFLLTAPRGTRAQFYPNIDFTDLKLVAVGVFLALFENLPRGLLNSSLVGWPWWDK